MEQTKIIFDLSAEQSKQLSETGECVALEPIELYPIGPEYEFLRMDKGGESGGVERKVSIRREWNRVFDYNIDKELPAQLHPIPKTVTLPQEGPYELQITKQPASTMPKELHLRATIKDINVKRVQEAFIHSPVNDYLKTKHRKSTTAQEQFDLVDREESQFKNYFNKQFAQPRPVECKKCKASQGFIQKCYSPNCDGIESYISYVYDEDSILKVLGKDKNYNSRAFDVDGQGSDISHVTYKDIPLHIITNPYLWIINLKKRRQSEQNKPNKQ